MPERVVFLDETAVKTNLTRLQGWAPRGERLVMEAPFGSWGTQTLIAGLTPDGRSVFASYHPGTGGYHMTIRVHDLGRAEPGAGLVQGLDAEVGETNRRNEISSRFLLLPLSRFKPVRRN